jgi:hypothetical protein
MEPIPPPSEVDDDGSPSSIIPEPIPQEGEIEAARWLPLSEFRDMVNNDDVKIGHPMMARIMKVLDSDRGGMERTIIPSVVPGRRPSPLYHAPIVG